MQPRVQSRRMLKQTAVNPLNGSLLEIEPKEEEMKTKTPLYIITCENDQNGEEPKPI